MSLLHASDPEAAKPVDEGFLAALGIHRLAVTLPFLEAGGPVNVCAIEERGGGYALFDAGLGTEEAWAELTGQTDARGIDLATVRRIIVSHGHIDHYGNAQRISELSGAPVFVHPADEEKLCGDQRWFHQVQQNEDYYLQLGVPRATLDAMRAHSAKVRTFSAPVERARVQGLVDGQALEFKHFTAEVLHLPGHTPGLVCLWAAEPKLLFADDHVLARVSPNPLLDLSQGVGPEKFKALVSYRKSAQRVLGLGVETVLPGHGACFTNMKPLLDGLFDFYARRQDRLVAKLREAPASVWDLLHLLFPRADVPRLYLMISETLGNLEVLEEDGRVRCVTDGGVHRYVPV